ncbi:MAG: serine hydrolase [Candidatus Palauibacterales bacterium]|nr:serine hydrolase [Candidatus Palauibacterales bacterium]
MIDGTGSPAVNADVGISGDSIAAVGDLSGATADTVIDASGLVVAPGFIDGHTHAGIGLTDSTLSAARPQLAQGVTTVMVNPDGGGPADLTAQRRALREDGIGVNVAQFVPYGSVRSAVMGEEDRAPTPAEREELRRRVRQGMEAGAIGLSTGLFYPPGTYAETDEVVDAARVAARHGGVYQSHVRDEGGYSVGGLAANRELIEIARRARITAIHTHIKAFGPREWGLSDELVEQIEEARSDGLAVFADLYPYRAAGGSVASILVPREALAGGEEALRARLQDEPQARDSLLSGIRRSIELEGGPSRIQLRGVPSDSGLEGMTLAEASRSRDTAPASLALDLLLEGGAGFVTFGMKEGDIETFLRKPWTMIASDGVLSPAGAGIPHPRGYGTFPTIIETWVRDRGTLELEEAIRRMTSLYREAYPIHDRGVLAEGQKADVVVFDPERVRDRSTYLEPRQLAEGMVHVLVNGRLAIRDGEFTGVRAGRVLNFTRSRESEGRSAGPARVDSVFSAFDDTRSPGCAVGVRRDGETLLARGYGMANLEHGIPIAPESVFRIGSVSKQFTAAAVLLLARDGTLSLDDPVRRWVPELPSDPYSGVTIRHLLHHTSGVRDYLTLMTLAGKREEDYYDDSEVVGILGRQDALNFRPGSDYLYSNAGYFLLGKIVESASGRSLRAFARDRIFGPLGMDRSHFHDRPDHLVPKRATGYEPREEGGYRRSVTTLPMVGDGGVYTSVQDFFRWSENLSDPSVGGAEFGERMTRRGVLSSGDTIEYARGLRVDRYRGLRRVSHGGAFVGYRAGMMRFPEQDFSAVALCNRADAEPMEKLGAVAEIYLDSVMTPPGEGEAGEGSPDAGGEEEEAGWSPAPGTLQRYRGRYESPELDAVYRIELDGRELRLVVGNRLDGELEPAGEGVFERSFLTLRFPDPAGERPDGFQLDAGRVQGISFERISDPPDG